MSGRRIAWAACALVALASGPGCEDTEVVACPGIAIPAAVVTVVDVEGAVVSDARVTWSQDGGELREVRCEKDPGGLCTWWPIWSLPQPTPLLVRATSADGSRSTEQTVQPQRDLCWYRTQHVTLRLK